MDLLWVRHAEPERIAGEIEKILTEPAYAAAIRTKLSAVRGKLGSGGGSARVANLVLDMVKR